MGAVTITPADLAAFATIDEAKATIMCADTLARAAVIAPCITSDDFEQADAAKAILRGVILRWNDAGTGAKTQKSETTGPFSNSETVDATGGERRGLFWPSEIAELEKLCAASKGGAFTIETAPGLGDGHGETCSLRFGGASCSCGYDIAGYPLYEILP